MKKNRIETTIPIIPIPIGMLWKSQKGYLNKIKVCHARNARLLR